MILISIATMVSLLLLSLFSCAAQALLSYAPLPAICPSGSLVRPASGLSPDEEAYRLARKVIADEALASWLTKTNPGFGTAELPTVCLSRDNDFIHRSPNVGRLR